MRREALDFLICPNCGGGLVLKSDPAEAAADGHLIAGALGCDDCSSQFPIRDGVPVLLRANLAAVKLETASRFAEEWTRWSELRDYYEQEFFDWVAPLTAADFAGQMVFEGGCGKGRHTAIVAARDRKSTRLNSSHLVISYAVFCLKKKKNKEKITTRLKKQIKKIGI